MDLNLLGKSKMGRPKGALKGDKVELENCLVFLKARNIGVSQVSRTLGLSITLVYRWFKGNITPQRLEELKELVKAIKVWEQENGRKYGG